MHLITAGVGWLGLKGQKKPLFGSSLKDRKIKLWLSQLINDDRMGEGCTSIFATTQLGSTVFKAGLGRQENAAF